MAISVKDVMTPDPMTLPPTATVGAAYALMHEHGFRHVPIVEGIMLLGLISMSDIGHLGARVPAILAMSVHEAMTTKLMTIGLEESVAAAAATMALRKVNCLLVLEEEQLAGIVTTYDLLDALAHHVRRDVE